MQQTRTRLIIVDIIAQVVLSLAIGVTVSLTLAATVLLLTSTAEAQVQVQVQPQSRGASAAESTAPPVAMKPGDAQSGSLLFRSHVKGDTLKGDTFAVPQVATDVHIRVSGIVARATVRQTFRNPYDDWYEGIYVFPLPEHAAVDHLQMKIGERSVVGIIQERQAAKAAYEQARAGGRRAALLEQERPNIFTSSVANVGPREDIVVEIEYQQKLHYDQGRLSLRFPTAVAPRYIPGTVHAVQMAGLSSAVGRGWSPNTDVVSDAQRITPPLLDPRATAQPAHAFTLKVELDAGVPVAAVDSPYHPIAVNTLGASRREITLQGAHWATKDFELSWSLAPSSAPRTAFFTEQKNGQTYGLLMVVPPTTAARAGATLPREVIFVIDTSGSMNGASIAQAREALALAIERLGEQDRFNVIEFNSRASALFDAARPANRAHRYEAVTWVRNLRAQGGTEMRPALQLALNGADNSGRVRQVIFLTDGEVGNEEQLFRLINERLGDSRLFTVGIGSAPNGHFMTKAAEAGRGTYTYIGKIAEMQDKMSALFAKLESPVLKGVQVIWPQPDASAAAVEAWPRRVPDLYLGEPIVMSAALGASNTAAQGDAGQREVRLSGMSGDAPWQAAVPLASASPGAGVGVLWARDKIAALTDGLRDGRSEDEVRPAILEVALAHHLVSKYTSLVAVDRSARARPADAPIKSASVPVNLPEGMNYAMVDGSMAVGELPQGATGVRADLLAGCLLLMLAAMLLWQRRRPRVWASAS